jgi:Fe-S-cluster-containing dehydrogenase component
MACALAHSGYDSFEELALSGDRPGYRINVEHLGATPVPVSCQHCEEPACALACPTGAVKRLAPGKPVLVDKSRCIGCTMCVQACPFGMMMMAPDGKSSLKCDLCIERLAKHQLPACVSSCPTKTLHYEEEGEANKSKRQTTAERLVAAQAQAESQSIG